jgi:hypothetical protein
MSAKSNYLENKILDHVIGGGDYTRPATLYFALYTSDPTDADTGTEVTGGSYARANLTNNATNFPAASGGSKSNAVAITFAAATALWGTVTHFGIRDALTGGNLLYYAPLTDPRTVNSGDVFSVAIGQLVISEL